VRQGGTVAPHRMFFFLYMLVNDIDRINTSLLFGLQQASDQETTT
jgi:hypothetical protein